MSEIDLADVQGNVLRGYRAANARHLAVHLPSPAAGRRLLGELLDPEPPRLSDSGEWRGRPDHCLNVGVTWPGLRALGVPDRILGAFPAAFRAGAAARATAPDPDGIRGVGLGDVGESRPDRWTLGNPAGPEAHLVLSLFCDEHRRPVRETLSAAMRAAIERAGATETWSADADALPEGRVHFGYRDGISQPRIAGAPGQPPSDGLSEMPVGDLLLGCGYRNSFGGNHIGAVPGWLGDNATYAAFRVLEQDCAAFERFLDRWSVEAALDREWVAAKLLGRWRNGAPLATHPDAAHPTPPTSAINRFDYVPTPVQPGAVDDRDGSRCPAGSHIRRCHPRSAPVLGIANTRRIIRRGMPYGPPFDPRAPDDGIERGLIGLFLCADLELSYEFVLRAWANGDIGAPGLRGTRDPLIGAQPPGGGHVSVPLPDRREPLVLSGLPNLTRTRGSAYCLLPGRRALAQLAASP